MAAQVKPMTQFRCNLCALDKTLPGSMRNGWTPDGWMWATFCGGGRRVRMLLCDKCIPPSIAAKLAPKKRGTRSGRLL